MKRIVNKDQFLKVLKKRPALIRSIQNPSEALLLKCIEENRDVLKYMPIEWKTLELCSKAIMEFKFIYSSSMENFPKEILSQMSEKVIDYAVSTGDCMEHFPQATYKNWLTDITKNSYRRDFEKIPEAFRTEEMLILHITNNGTVQSIPEKYWTPTLITATLNNDSDDLKNIPFSLIDAAVVKQALEVAKRNDKRLNLPDKIKIKWTQEIADLACEVCHHNYELIPNELKTLENSLVACAIKGDLFNSVPKQYQSNRELQLTACSHWPDRAWETLPKILLSEIKNPQFQIDLAKEEAKADSEGTGIENLLTHKIPISSDTLIEIIKILPTAIKYIDKLEQSSEVVATLIQTCPISIIDSLAGHINLGKITKEHAPLLIGTQNSTLQDLILRKLKTKPKQAVVAPVATPNGIEVDLTDKDIQETGLK